MITCSIDTPLSILRRVTSQYGVVGNDGYSLTVVANDERAEELIDMTLQILGFGTSITPDPPGATVHQIRPQSVAVE